MSLIEDKDSYTLFPPAATYCHLLTLKTFYDLFFNGLLSSFRKLLSQAQFLLID
jgi:hypothetical protein